MNCLQCEYKATPELTPEVKKLIQLLKGAISRNELQKQLGLKDEKHFREYYQKNIYHFKESKNQDIAVAIENTTEKRNLLSVVNSIVGNVAVK